MTEHQRLVLSVIGFGQDAVISSDISSDTGDLDEPHKVRFTFKTDHAETEVTLSFKEV